MTFVDINTNLVRTGASDLMEVFQKIGSFISLSTDAQTVINDYESPQRAPTIKKYLQELLDAAPLIQSRAKDFSEFLDGVARTYDSIG
jgi:hypothetical protein